MTAITKNASTNSYTDGADFRQNVQALCEMIAGLASGEGSATWGGSADTLTVTDSRVTANSTIHLTGARGALPLSTWYVSGIADGQFVINSGEVESSSCIAQYLVQN